MQDRSDDLVRRSYPAKDSKVQDEVGRNGVVDGPQHGDTQG